jgi:nucleotide-binding universal stress UspA family protein
MNVIKAEAPVVVAVEGDQPVLVAYAAKEARRRHTELLVLHVYGTVLQDVGAVAAVTASPRDDADAEAVLDAAKTVVSAMPDAPPARYIAVVGSTIEVIEHHAAGARLLVIGADEMSWFERMLGGTIARHLAEHAPCPVIVLPHGHDLSILYGGVCVAVDDDPSSQGPLRFAFEEASARQTELIVLHVVPESLKQSALEARRAGVAEVLAGWREEFPDVVVTPRIVHDGEVAAASARASEQCELLVVGRTRRSFLTGHAVPARLTRTTHAPLAVVMTSYSGAGSQSVSGGQSRR